MIKNLLQITIRNFWKQKFYSLINVFGFSVGLTTVILILLYVTHELSFDRFHKKSDVLARVVENQYYTGQPVFPVAVTPIPLGASLQQDYPEIKQFTRLLNNTELFEKNGEVYPERGAYVDPSFLDMFSFKMELGNKEDALSKKENIVLTEKLAAKYFDDENPVGKTIVIHGKENVVSGVLKDFPDNSHIQEGFLKPFDAIPFFTPSNLQNWSSNTLYTYVEVNDGVDFTSLSEKISGQIKKHNENSITDIYLQPLTDIHLGTVQFVAEMGAKGNNEYVQMFVLIAAFILILACINFMNLSTAKSVNRAKEVGLRKTLGALRSQLVLQFMGESLMMTIFAMTIAIFLADMLLPFFSQLAGVELTLRSMTSSTGMPMLFWVLCLTFLTGLIAGSYPSFFLSRFHPSNVLKGAFKGSRRGSMLRKVLVVIQFSISIFLIIGTLVVQSQLNYIRNLRLGINKDNILYIQQVSNNYDVFRNDVMNLNGVTGIGLANQHPAYVENSSSGVSWEGADPNQVILFHFESIDEGYVDAMGLEIIKGREFDGSLPGDTATVLINEEAEKIMGFREPVGQVINAGGQEFTIIGVVKDFHFKSVHTKIEPLIMVDLPQMFNRTFVKVSGENVPATIASIKNIWEQLNPGHALNYHFLDEDYQALYQSEETTSRIFTYFTLLAFIISGLGLFGLSSFSAEQRVKEISIRKVMGASSGRLFWIVSKDLTGLSLFSVILAVPLGWLWVNSWLKEFAYKTHLSIWIYVAASALGILVTFLTVSYQSLRVASSNPANHLRNE